MQRAASNEQQLSVTQVICCPLYFSSYLGRVLQITRLQEWKRTFSLIKQNRSYNYTKCVPPYRPNLDNNLKYKMSRLPPAMFLEQAVCILSVWKMLNDRPRWDALTKSNEGGSCLHVTIQLCLSVDIFVKAISSVAWPLHSQHLQMLLRSLLRGDCRVSWLLMGNEQRK